MRILTDWNHRLLMSYRTANAISIYAACKQHVQHIREVSHISGSFVPLGACTTLAHVILSNDPVPSAETVDAFNLPPSHSVLLEFQLLCRWKWLQLLSLQAELEVLPRCSLVKG